MGVESLNRGNEQGQWVEADITREELVKRLLAKQTQATRPSARRGPAPERTLKHSSQQEHIKPRRSPVSKRTKRWLAAAASVAAAGALTAGVYSNNVGNVQSMVNRYIGRPVLTNGPDTLQPRQLGPGSLSPEQCNDPNAALLALKISGDMKLVPQYNDTAKTIAEPFLTPANETAFTGEALTQFKASETDDGYPHITLSDLPVDVLVCGSDGIVQHGDSLTGIVRNKIHVHVEDPNDVYGTIIQAVKQTKGPKSVVLHPDKDEYISIPHPYVPKSKNGDAAFDKFMTDSIMYLQTSEGVHTALKVMETEAIQEINSDISGQEPIEYPDGSTHSLGDAIDNALIYRMTGGNTTQPDYQGNYYDIQYPKNPTTKLPMTSLPGFDSTQKFHITNAKVEYGPMKPPAKSSTTTSAESSIKK